MGGENKDSKFEIKPIPMYVSKVYVHGLKRSKDDFVEQITKRLLNCTSTKEIVEKCTDVQHVLKRLNVAKDVGVHIDSAEGEHAYDIHLTMKESRWYSGAIQGFLGNGDTSTGVGAGVSMQGSLPNLVGRGEQVKMTWTKGISTGKREFIFEKPIGGEDKDTIISGSIFRDDGNFPFSGYREIDRGVTGSLSTPLHELVTQNLSWLGVWRHLKPLERVAFPVREQAGHYLKSSCKSETKYDSRDDKSLPNEGTLLSGVLELAGIGGDARFISTRISGQWNVPYKAMTLQLNMGLGTIFPINLLQSRSAPITIMDKFFLGGPTSLRGFEYKGVGPRNQYNALGADSYWQAGAHLRFRLPGNNAFLEQFRGQLFVNSGNLLDWPEGKTLRELAKADWNSTRMSYGVGLVTNFLGIKFEVNYCWPHWSQQNDKTQQGFQFGVSLED